VRGVSSLLMAGWRRPRLLVAGAATVAALAAAGCGEKSEPDVHPPTTAPVTTPAPTTTTPAPTQTKTGPTATAPVPKQGP
jgi:hypothetical protein